MKIVVCLKQVPRPDSVRFHPKTKRIVREDVATMTNPLDLVALGHALTLRETTGGEITVVSMGPPEARSCLEDAIARGADRAILLTDRRFAGADTLATVRALARTLEVVGFDLILLGRSTLDGATAQVAPQLAELLDLPQVTQATSLRVEGPSLVADQETDDGEVTWTARLPAVVSVLRGPAPPEPDPDRRAEVEVRTAEDLGGGPRDYGTRGSPTFVRDVRVLPAPSETAVIEDLDGAVRMLAQRIDDAGEARPAPRRSPAGDAARTIWALAERRRDGSLHPVSHEAIACGRSVADAYRARVVAVLLCASAGDAPAELTAHGADSVLVVEDPRLADYETEAFTAALCAAIEANRPEAIVAPWTAEGRDFVPRAAARLGLGLTGDIVALEVDGDEDPDLLWIKPAWSGSVEAPVIGHTTPSMGTLRPGAVAPLASDPARKAAVDILRPELEGSYRRAAAGARSATLAPDGRVDGAPLVVCVGADADDQLVRLAGDLARRGGGVLAASEAAVASGLLPPQCEVGILRRSVAPRLFVAVGEHTADDLAAARHAGVVVTVGGAGPLPPHTRVDIAVALPATDVLAGVLAVTAPVA